MVRHIREIAKHVPGVEDPSSLTPEGPAIDERGTGAAISRVPMLRVEDVDVDVLIEEAFAGNIGAAGTRSPSAERSTVPCTQSARIILSLLYA